MDVFKLYTELYHKIFSGLYLLQYNGLDTLLNYIYESKQNYELIVNDYIKMYVLMYIKHNYKLKT